MPTSEEKPPHADQDHEEDASATDHLLPTSDNDDATPSPSTEGDSRREKGDGPNWWAQFNYEDATTFPKRNMQWVIAVASVLATLCFVFFLRDSGSSTVSHAQPSDGLSRSGFSGPRNTITFINGTQFVKPPELKIIGIIFFGRRQFVRILECYLRRNLRVNGGILDEVHFLMHTDDKKDRAWLEALVRDDGMEEYYKLKADLQEGNLPNFHLWGTFPGLYKRYMTDKNSIYIKMDDDMCFIDDYALPELIRVTLEHPEAYNIQANVINNRWNQWQHLRTHAIWPYLPEQGHRQGHHNISWRPSELPRYNGKIPSKNYRFRKYKIPHEGLRWLPVEPTYENLARTPYGHRIRNPMSKNWDAEESPWTLAVQSHHSFFENFERKELIRFNYGNRREHIWNQWYTRYNINMFAIRGTHVLLQPNIWAGKKNWRAPNGKTLGDEPLITEVIPKELDMPVLIATKSIASHLSFQRDRKQLLKTDVMQRYEALAREFYCIAPMHDADDMGDEIGDGPQDIFNPDDPEDDEDHEHNEEDQDDHN